MIKVKIGNQFIQIEGHAGYSKKGTDIVCAAVSALGQSLKHIDELYREFNVNEDGMLRVDFHDPLAVIQSFAIDRREYLEKQLKNHVIAQDVKDEIQAELDDWENQCRQFAHMAKSKGLIISNQIDLIIKAIKEVAVNYPKHVEVLDVD